MSFNKPMLSNPDFYLILIFVFAILIAFSSYMHGRYTNIEANKKHSELDKSVLGVTNKIVRVNSQLDTLSAYLDTDLKIKIDNLTNSVNEFQVNFTHLNENIIKTQSIILNPHHPFDLELIFKVDLKKFSTVYWVKKAIEDDNRGNDLNSAFSKHFKGEMEPFMQDRDGNVLSLGSARYYLDAEVNSFEHNLNFFRNSNQLFEELMRRVSMQFSLNKNGQPADEHYDLDCRTLIKYNKINTESTYKVQDLGGDYPDGSYIRLKIVIKDLNFGLTNGKISNLNDLLNGCVSFRFDYDVDPYIMSAKFDFGTTAKKTYHINFDGRTPGIQRHEHDFVGYKSVSYTIDMATAFPPK